MQTVVGQCCYSKCLFSLRQFLVQEMGLGAVMLRARQYIAITNYTVALTDSSERNPTGTGDIPQSAESSSMH